MAQIEDIGVDSDGGRKFEPEDGQAVELGVSHPDDPQHGPDQEHDLSVDADAIDAFLLLDLVEEHCVAPVVCHVTQQEKPQF